MRKMLILILFLVSSILANAVTRTVGTGGTYATLALANAAWNAGTFAPGDSLNFKRGETFYGTLTISESGINGSPMIVGAWGATNLAKPIITGFQTITGWTNDGGGIYSKIITPESAPNMLTIDGVQYALGRYPNAGTNLIYESASTNVSITDNQLTGTPNWTGAEVVIYKNSYTLDRCLITSHVVGTLTYTNLGTTRSAVAGQPYFIQNDLRTLDAYGEWYYNLATGKLSVYFGGTDPTTNTTKVSTIDNLISNTGGFDNITIDNLDLQGSNSSAILFGSNTSYCVFKNCNVSFSGYDALTLSCTVVTINNNTITNCNAGGIVSNGASSIVTNNTLTNIGVIAGQTNQLVSTIGITINGNNPSVQYNSIAYTGYMGIYFTIAAITGTISYNFINYPCQILFDSGGIYMGHTHTGTIIESNIVLNSGGNGIYLDEYCTGVTAVNNTISGCSNNGIKLHKSNHNTVIGNLSYNNGTGIILENWLDENNLGFNTITNNIFIAKLPTQLTLHYINRYTTHLTTLASCVINSNYYTRPVDDNLTFNTDIVGAGDGLINIAGWKTFSNQDANSKGYSSDTTGMRFEYNATSSDKVVSLTGSYRTIPGTVYINSITLPAFSSAILFPYIGIGTGSNVILDNNIPLFDGTQIITY